MLDVKNISVYYDKVCALSNISFHVDEGEMKRQMRIREEIIAARLGLQR